MKLDEMFAEHLHVIEESRRSLADALGLVVRETRARLRSGGKVLACGNGGSAADAQHFAAECVCRFERDRPPIAAIALTTDTSGLTAISNDLGYDQVFARQVQALARAGDVLYAISTSGNSSNVLRAAEAAKSIGCYVVGFSGRGGGKLASLVDTLIAVPSERVARIQEAHELCLHAIAAAIEHQEDV